SAPISESQKIGEQVRQYFLTKEDNNVDLVLIRYGRNNAGTGQNLAQGFIALKPWDVRTAKEDSADAIQKRAMKYFRNFSNAQINVTLPPSVNGLGQTDGL
ncbi:efflux RND transporter permease subunit, partial [Acinetobacter baumannii]